MKEREKEENFKDGKTCVVCMQIKGNTKVYFIIKITRYKFNFY